MKYDKNEKALDIKAVCLRDGQLLGIRLEANDGTSLLHVCSNSMETASDVIQSLLGEHLHIDQALAVIDFPKDFEQLDEVLDRIKQSTSLKTHFAANIAESIQNLKVSVVKAEASLMINDIAGMRRNYAQVH